MSKEMQIKEITYERERLDFFTELMKLAQTRYNLLHRRFKDAPYLSEAHQTLSDMGREVQFFGDVVEMLEKGYRKQSGWISAEERLPEKAGRYLVYGVIGGQPLVCGMYYNKYNGFDGEITHWMTLPEPPKGE